MKRRAKLTEHQTSLIQRYAQLLPSEPVDWRRVFVEGCFARLAGEPGDAAVDLVITGVFCATHVRMGATIANPKHASDLTAKESIHAARP
jgi:hypothetical protein